MVNRIARSMAMTLIAAAALGVAASHGKELPAPTKAVLDKLKLDPAILEGKSVSRKELKPGMTCKVTYLGAGGRAKEVSCRN